MPRPRRSSPPREATEHQLWQQIRARRLELGITQAEVADLAGLSRTTVHTIEAGSLSPRLGAVVAVADVLGCDVALSRRGER